MIIKIPPDGTLVAKKFRGIEGTFSKLKFSWKFVDYSPDVMAEFSLDERTTGDFLAETRGLVSINKILDVMPIDDFKLAVEASLCDTNYRKDNISSLAHLLDSFSWSTAVPPSTDSWNRFYDKAISLGY